MQCLHYQRIDSAVLNPQGSEPDDTHPVTLQKLFRSCGTTSGVQVAEDHCWISLDSSCARSSAAEVATAKGQGEPPTESNWKGWLYSAGHAHVCAHRQVVAAILTSMDTCIGEKATDDLHDARQLQCKLLQRLESIDPDALYTNAVCVLAELQQDAVLDAAKQAAKQGGDVREELKRLQPLHQAMLRAAGLTCCSGTAPVLVPPGWMGGVL
jgi:hypothetical protein